MTTTIEGDFSKYPISIQKVFPHLAGEACELRQSWVIYSHLFMEKKKFTDAMAERLGGVLVMFQSLLQDAMFLSIARLTDKDSHGQTNLSLWGLLAAIPDTRNANFGDKVKNSLDQIYAAAADIRKHRHKRLAHFDLSVSLSTAVLPVIVFTEIRSVMEQIETFLNLFYWEFENTTMFFDSHSAYDITGKAEETMYKAQAYDLLEAEGMIPKLEWRRRAEK
jgi:AbiU2